MLIHILRRGGWKVVAQPHIAGARPDFVIRRGNRQYVVELKSSAEPRRDRLLPLLAQAILEAKAAASKASVSARAKPLAVIGAPHLSAPLIDELRSFAQKVAPGVAIGVIDLESSHVFTGDGLDELSHLAERPSRLQPVPQIGARAHLFSDLSQWMLKVLLAPRIPDRFLRASRDNIATASDLAKAASVSLMSASRFVHLLRAEGFLDDSRGFHLVNIDMLLEQWRAANRKAFRAVPMRWIIPGDPRRQLLEAIRAYIEKPKRLSSASRPRVVQARYPLAEPRLCLGLFAAAEALGFKVVRGVAPHLYLERLDRFALESLSLVPVAPGQRSDVIVRVPSFRESIFRPVVIRHGVAISDAIQVWLDVADHPVRGENQAEAIWRHVLAPVLNQGSR